MTPAVGRIVCRLLADQRVSPAAGHLDLVRRWAICGGMAALSRVADTCPEALSGVHPCVIEQGAYCDSHGRNEIAIDFLLGRGVIHAGPLFPSSLDSADVASVLFRAIMRGNLPPVAVSNILSLPSTQLGEVFSCSLEALVTTQHCIAYSTCAALSPAERQAHVSGSPATSCVSFRLDSAVSLCELDVCAELACRRSTRSLPGSCNDTNDVASPSRSLMQHCLGVTMLCLRGLTPLSPTLVSTPRRAKARCFSPLQETNSHLRALSARSFVTAAPTRRPSQISSLPCVSAASRAPRPWQLRWWIRACASRPRLLPLR